jgi:hypothetical protein
MLIDKIAASKILFFQEVIVTGICKQNWTQQQQRQLYLIDYL